jgi:hypothetical protein
MEELKILKEFINLKEKLKNRAILYKDIISAISDELGFKFFSNLFNDYKYELIISKEFQVNFFLNRFYDSTHFYNEDERKVFYEMAQIIYALDKNEKWEKFTNFNKDEFEESDVYVDRIIGFCKEFDELAIQKSENWKQNKSLRDEPLESGHIIALAFYMLDNNRIEEEYVSQFCKALDEYIIFISDTEFYQSEPKLWLEKFYGLDEKPKGFELPN